MTALDKLRAASPEVRDLALELLDEVSRPMTVRELDYALAAEGFTRSERRPMVRALKRLDIVALYAAEPEPR